MPIDRKSCDQCGTAQHTCPDCGSMFVTAVDAVKVNGEYRTFGDNFEKYILQADDGDDVEIISVCWDCNWRESRNVRVEVE